MYCYDYPRPSVTVDIVLFADATEDPKVLLIRRKSAPFKDFWAVPGGFVEMEETLEESAKRELNEETNISDVQLTQIGTFGHPDRDPRGRVISVAYVGIIESENTVAIAGSDAAEVAWFSTLKLPALAFDHSEIIKKALEEIK